MATSNDDVVQQLLAALKHEPFDTPLGMAVARLREPFCVGDDKQIHYDKVISMFSAIRQALHELDPSVSPNLPPFLMDPVVIAKILGVPLEKLDYQGGPPAVADPSLLSNLKRIVAYLEAGASYKVGQLNESESNILEALGDRTMIGEELAAKAGYSFNGNFKATLSSLVKRGILDNMRPGYCRL